MLLLLLRGLSLVATVVTNVYGNREFTLTVPANFTAIAGKCRYALANTNREFSDISFDACAIVCLHDKSCGSFHYTESDVAEQRRCQTSNFICNPSMTTSGPGFINRTSDSNEEASSTVYLMKTKETWFTGQQLKKAQIRPERSVAIVPGCCKLQDGTCGASAKDNEESSFWHYENAKQCHAQCLNRTECLSYRIRWTKPDDPDEDGDCFISSVICASMLSGQQLKSKGRNEIDESLTYFMTERIFQRNGTKAVGEKIKVGFASSEDECDWWWLAHAFAASLLILPCMLIAWATNVRYEPYIKFDNEA